MAFRNDADQGTVQHRPQKSLPPISQLVNGNDSSSVQGGPLSSSTQTMEAWHELRNSPGPTFDANEVMKKALETMNQQIRDNGYDPDNLPNRNPPTRANGTRPPSGHVEEVNEEPQANVYQVRADDIGLGHRIPGVGHLGDLLTPPGWKPGDEPVSLNRARLLRNQAYEAARKKMNDSTAEFKDLKGAAFQEASDLKNEEWQNQNNLNKLIYDERVKVWKDSQDRKLKGSQDSSKVLPVRGLAQANDGHQPAQPVLNRPQARNPRTRRPALPAITVSRPADGSGRPEPSPKLLSPSFLDPELVPGTFQAVVQGYRQRKTELEQSFRDNELQLRQCLTRYGPHISPAHQSLQQAPAPAQLNTTPDDQAAQQAPSTRLRLHAQQAQMHQANGNGQQNYGSVYGPTAQQPQRRATYPTPPPAYPPPAYPAEHSESYARAGNEQETRGHKNGSRALTTSRYSAHVDQNGLGIYDDEPTELALTPQKPQRHGQQAEQDADADAEPTNTPSKKRNAPTKKPTPKV